MPEALQRSSVLPSHRHDRSDVQLCGIGHEHDDGFHRRARIWQTTQTFRAKPEKLTEHKADDTLKARMLDGEFNSQLVWLLRGLWETLEPAVNPDTTLLPIPVFLREL